MIIWIYLGLFIQEADELLQFQKSILLIQTKLSTKSIYSTVCVILSMYLKKYYMKTILKNEKTKKKHYFSQNSTFWMLFAKSYRLQSWSDNSFFPDLWEISQFRVHSIYRAKYNLKNSVNKKWCRSREVLNFNFPKCHRFVRKQYMNEMNKKKFSFLSIAIESRK